MLEYVYGTKERIFINTVIGCQAKCSYCYLPSLLIEQSECRITVEEVINRVKSMKEFIPGKDNTIISLGCYSECMFKENVQNTLDIIYKFAQDENYIQLATKQKIDEEVIQDISDVRSFKDQINIYVSMPTYSKIQSVEPGTASLEDRIHNIEVCKKYGVNVILYIKPFLEDITLKDIYCYIDLVKKYHIPVVVGEYLSTEVTKNVADVGENLLYESEKNENMEKFLKKISKYTEVYTHSIEFINSMRKENK